MPKMVTVAPILSERAVFIKYHANGLVAMETNGFSSFSHTPSTFLPGLVPIGPETAEKKKVKHTSNSNYSMIETGINLMTVLIKVSLSPVIIIPWLPQDFHFIKIAHMKSL